MEICESQVLPKVLLTGKTRCFIFPLRAFPANPFSCLGGLKDMQTAPVSVLDFPAVT
jgi:hypothetical protein